MVRYCTKCGKELRNGEKCACQSSSNSAFVEKLNEILVRIGIGKSNEEKSTLLEQGKIIVPDVVKPNDGEIGIKQFSIATLRSRIKGEYAKGRLLITNKRLIFRAPGFSYKGRIILQHEFAIDEIAGIEVKKTNRISFLNVLLAIVSIAVVAPIFSIIFDGISSQSTALGLISAIVFAVITVVPFFVFKGKWWLKLIAMNCGLGALLGTSGLANISTSSLFFGIQANITDFIAILFLILWLLNLILVCIVPDLTLIIRTKGATEAITIKRKQYATLFKQEVDYSGFGEIVPDRDIDIFIKEIGALIDDIQTFGDTAVERWKQ